MSLAERVIPDLDFKQDFSEIDKLQRIFDSRLGQSSTSRILSYDPVLERWQFERSISEEDEISFRKHEEKQIETTLKERLSTFKSSIVYKVEDRRAFNELLPDEPFDVVLRRGIAYREIIGSTETEREQAELDGYLKIVDHLTDPETPINSKFMVISGPGVVKETVYPHNFVDIYEKVETPQGEIAVQMTRTASQMEYADYSEQIKIFQSEYFDNFSGPIDAWFLSHPVPIAPQPDLTTPDEIFENVFERKIDSMDDEMFQDILEACMPLILNYIDVLCGNVFDPKQIAIAFNAVLNKADLEKAVINQRGQNKTVLEPMPIFRNVREEAYFLGTRPVKEVMAGCGLSGGFGTDSTLNSVAQFARETAANGWHTGICAKCSSLTSVGGCNICATCVLLYYSNN